MNLKETKNWLAGLFEGDGTTGIYHSHREDGSERLQTYFMITNADPVIIRKAKKIAKKIGVEMHYTYEDRETDNWNSCYRLQAKNLKDVYILLDAIYPYLCGRKKIIAALTMEFCKSRDYGRKRGTWGEYTERDWNLFHQCKRFTQRGEDRIMPESSETIRQALKGEDIVRTLMRIGE